MHSDAKPYLNRTAPERRFSTIRARWQPLAAPIASYVHVSHRFNLSLFPSGFSFAQMAYRPQRDLYSFQNTPIMIASSED